MDLQIFEALKPNAAWFGRKDEVPPY